MINYDNVDFGFIIIIIITYHLLYYLLLKLLCWVYGKTKKKHGCSFFT